MQNRDAGGHRCRGEALLPNGVEGQVSPISKVDHIKASENRGELFGQTHRPDVRPTMRGRGRIMNFYDLDAPRPVDVAPFLIDPRWRCSAGCVDDGDVVTIIAKLLGKMLDESADATAAPGNCLDVI